jgi:hypothetical protein
VIISTEFTRLGCTEADLKKANEQLEAVTRDRREYSKVFIHANTHA